MNIREVSNRTLLFPWTRFFNRLYEIADDSDIFNRAAQAAFYFSFALFPFVFFLVSLFGIVLESTDQLKAALFNYLQQLMPGSVFVLVRNTVDEVVASSSGSKLTLGLIATLWSASSGVDAVRAALNSIYNLRERRSWWLTKLHSLILTLLVSVLVAVGLAIVFYGWQIVRSASASAGLPITSPFILVGIQWISIVIVMLLACEIVYNFLPDFRKVKWIWITYGSIVAITLWLILTSGFRLYLHFFNNYDKTYGSLGAVIILMLWLYLTALVLMIGGAINAVLREFDDNEDSPHSDEVEQESSI